MRNKTNQTFVYIFEERIYGHFTYLELDHENKKFTIGTNKSHQGHHKNNIKVYLKRKRDLFELRDKVDYKNWEFVETFRFFN